MVLKEHADCLMLVATEYCLGFLTVDLYLTLQTWLIQYLAQGRYNPVLQHHSR